MVYEYDFGDGWSHEIVLEKVIGPIAGSVGIECLDGARACPPEDCGGPWGYQEFLEAIGDPIHPEHEEMILATTPRRAAAATERVCLRQSIRVGSASGTPF